ncbi:hypothetical protein D9M69_573190 [compost metagenome]
MKCMDHTPTPPRAMPTVNTLFQSSAPRRLRMRVAALRATKEPMTAKAKDRAMRPRSQEVLTMVFIGAAPCDDLVFRTA